MFKEPDYFLTFVGSLPLTAVIFAIHVTYTFNWQLDHARGMLLMYRTYDEPLLHLVTVLGAVLLAIPLYLLWRGIHNLKHREASAHHRFGIARLLAVRERSLQNIVLMLLVTVLVLFGISELAVVDLVR